MNTAAKDELLKRLAESHAAIREVIKGRDLEIRVYTDPDWRIRDVLGHIATWDLEVTRSLQAFASGTEYAIPDLDEDDFNQRTVVEMRKLADQQIITDWENAREGFKQAIQMISGDQFSGELLYPWGDERGDIPLLVRYMVEHDEQHLIEIQKALDKLIEDQ
jgi:hypothetical protein